MSLAGLRSPSSIILRSILRAMYHCSGEELKLFRASQAVTYSYLAFVRQVVVLEMSPTQKIQATHQPRPVPTW